MLMKHYYMNKIINTAEDEILLQKDLDTLTQWAQMWLMKFNTSIHTIDNSIIQQNKSIKYLGVTITDKLSWSEHITNITNKASSIRVLLQGNLNQCQLSVKSTCYTTYACPIPRICYNCLVTSPSLRH